MSTASGDLKQEVIRLEEEAARVEGTLGQELEKLYTAMRGAAERLEAVRSVAARLQGTVQNAPGWAALAQRLERATLPQVDLEVPWKQSAQARLEAARKRTQAAQAAVESLHGPMEEVRALLAQLATDEGQLSQFERTIRAQQEQAQKRAAEAAANAKTPALVPSKMPAAAQPPPALSPQARRTAPRVKMQAAVDLNSDSNFFTGFSMNISDGGLFVATVSAVPLGTEVDVRFSLPSGQAVNAHGVVRWVREVNDNTPDIFPGVGIQFVNLSPDAQQAIHQFVSSRDPMFFPD